MSAVVEKLRAWFGRAETAVGEEAHGARPVTTSPPGEPRRETSTNAQTEGAVGQPWDAES